MNPPHAPENVHQVRMGMSVAQAGALELILDRCDDELRGLVMDQLWLRTVFVMRRRQLEICERAAFDVRCDRVLERIDPRDGAR